MRLPHFFELSRPSYSPTYLINCPSKILKTWRVRSGDDLDGRVPNGKREEEQMMISGRTLRTGARRRSVPR